MVYRQPAGNESTTGKVMDVFWEKYTYPLFKSALDENVKQVENSKTIKRREQRLANFQASADKTLKINPADLLRHNIESLINKSTEEILASILLTNIQNYPGTTDRSEIDGSIQVAIIGSKIDESPYLIFSVNQGYMGVNFNESFSLVRSWFSLCFGEFCDSGDFNMAYEMKTTIAGQFFILKMDNVIESAAYLESSRSYAANTRSDKTSCQLYCFSLSACFNGCCRCQLLTDLCCDCQCNEVLVDQFKAEDEHVVGAEAPIKHESSFLSQNVNWNVKTGGFTDVMISLHFKSRQDNKVRQCKMRLATTHSYEDAKKFVVKLQNLTSSDLKYDSFKTPAVTFASLPKKSFWSMTRRKV